MTSRLTPGRSDIGVVGTGILLWVILYLTKSFINSAPSLQRGIQEWGPGVAVGGLFVCLALVIGLAMVYRRMNLTFAQACGIGALLALMPIASDVDAIDFSNKHSILRRAIMLVVFVGTSAAVLAFTRQRGKIFGTRSSRSLTV